MLRFKILKNLSKKPIDIRPEPFHKEFFFLPLCGTVLVLSSAQSAGIPKISMVTYGSVTSPREPEPLGLGKCCPLITYFDKIKPLDYTV